MKQTINFSQFRAGMKMATDKFSYEGLEILYDYLLDLEEQLGQDFEFDPVAFRCEYDEMSIDDIISEYDLDMSEVEAEWKDQTVTEWLMDNTILVGTTPDGTVIFNKEF